MGLCVHVWIYYLIFSYTVFHLLWSHVCREKKVREKQRQNRKGKHISFHKTCYTALHLAAQKCKCYYNKIQYSCTAKFKCHNVCKSCFSAAPNTNCKTFQKLNNCISNLLFSSNTQALLLVTVSVLLYLWVSQKNISRGNCWFVSFRLQYVYLSKELDLLDHTDVSLHVHHVSVPPIILEPQYQRIGFETTQASSLQGKE